jgi:hypothetical protein
MHRQLISILILSLCPVAAHAQDAWQTYVSHELGIAFRAPPGIETEIGATLRGDYVGTKEQPEFVVEQNCIEYRVGVANFAQAPMLGETVMGEALYLFQGEKPILSDDYSIKGEGQGKIYGRVSTVELPQGGWATTAFYFTNAKLYQLTATVSAANGNYDSDEPMRFIDSLTFDLSDVGSDAMELMLFDF